MTVFKTILKILNKLKGMLILYTVMLVAITAIISRQATAPLILKSQNRIF